jgi:hypothetical protein
MMKKIILIGCIIAATNAFAQVSFPHSAASAGSSSAERPSSFTVSDAGNDRLEVANGTQNDGQFVPTLWSYRNTSNSFSMVLTSSIAPNLDTGTSPLMLFTTTIAPQVDFGAPATGDFVWGPSGTYLPISTRPLFEWRNSSAKLMTIIANGNTGIGTDTPSSRLHVVNSVRFQNLANAANPSFMLGTDNNGNVFEYPVPTGGGTPGFDWLRPDNTFAQSINDNIYTNGFVGFNVQNPAATVHTNGTIRFENLANAANPTFMLGTDSNGNVFEYPVPAGGGGGVTDADWLKPDGTLALSIDDNIYTNGKVGINTNTFPATVGTEDVSFYNLYVTGGILTEEVRVALVDEWADYVFKKEYKLPTLKEVERHIEEKGHLINIPSEKEVKENGIELAEMNRLLLEKVEELTLYVIDLNKKVEEQQKEIEMLKKEQK